MSEEEMRALDAWVENETRMGTTVTVGCKPLGWRRISIRPQDRSWFGFSHRGQYYVQTELPFGWTSSPRLWGGEMAITEEAARRGIKLMMYVDDIMVLADTEEECRWHCQGLRDLLWRSWA